MEFLVIVYKGNIVSLEGEKRSLPISFPKSLPKYHLILYGGYILPSEEGSLWNHFQQASHNEDDQQFFKPNLLPTSIKTLGIFGSWELSGKPSSLKSLWKEA